MKTRFISLGVVVLLLASFHLADAGRGERGSRHRGQAGNGDRAGHLAQALSLTPQQQEQMTQLRQQLHGQLQSLREQGTNLRSEAQTLRQQHRQEIQSILTPEQLQTLQQMKTDRAQRLEQGDDVRGPRRRKGGDHPWGPGAAFGERLQLSDEQSDALQALRSTHRLQMESLREGGEISRERFQTLRAQHRAQVEELLTEEQRQLLEQLRAERAGQDRRRRRHRGQDADVPEESARPGVGSDSWGEVKKSVDEQ